ncbi:MAG: amidase family protein [archaeon]|nr:amidase family protein [archaeon]
MSSLPRDDSWVCDLSACAIATLVREGKVTPVEVVRQTYRRIHLVNPVLNAFVVLCEERALAEAQRQTELLEGGAAAGPLWGVPIGVKDLEEVEGLPTSYGSLLYKEKQQPARASSVQVSRLVAAGAIVVGKTNTPLFGSKATSHNRAFGATLNPFRTDMTPGGSSGGSAAAVSARLVPMATGSDGGGSIRIPAALSGCFGIKPTVGLVPINDMSYFEAETFSNVVHYGPLTRSVDDAALFLDVVCGHHPSDPHSIPRPAFSFASALAAGLPGERPLRVAFSRDLGYVDNVWPEVEEAVRAGLGVLQGSGAFAVTELTTTFTDICLAWVTLLGAEQKALLSPHPDFKGNLHLLEKSFVAAWDALEIISLPEIADVYRQRFRLSRELEALFSEYDLLITPTLPVSGFPPTGPMPMDGFSNPLHPAAGFTIPFNFSGHPAASVRCGITATGLPVGMQIVAARHMDHLVLQVAKFFENQTRCFDSWPSVSDIISNKRISKL